MRPCRLGQCLTAGTTPSPWGTGQCLVVATVGWRPERLFHTLQGPTWPPQRTIGPQMLPSADAEGPQSRPRADLLIDLHLLINHRPQSVNDSKCFKNSFWAGVTWCPGAWGPRSALPGSQMQGRGHGESWGQVVAAPGGAAMTEQTAGGGQRRGAGGATHGGHWRSFAVRPFENRKQPDKMRCPQGTRTAETQTMELTFLRGGQEINK